MSEVSRTFAEFALPAGMSALDPEHQINANLRDNGIGLVPRVLAVDEDAKTATVGCGAIMAMLDLPWGWHVIDDGRRVLVFDAVSQVQINLRLVDGEGQDSAVLIEHLIAKMAASVGEAKWLTLELAGMKTLAIRGLPVNQPGEAEVLVDQVYIYRPIEERAGWYCEVRTTTDLGKVEPALDMVELMIGSLRFAS